MSGLLELDCPFCPTMMKGREIVDESWLWVVIFNQGPYLNTRKHLLIVPKRHVVGIQDLTEEEVMERHKLIRKFRGALGGCSEFTRYGDRETTGSTVSHLHTHLVWNEPEKTIIVGFGPDDRWKKVDLLWLTSK